MFQASNGSTFDNIVDLMDMANYKSICQLMLHDKAVDRLKM